MSAVHTATIEADPDDGTPSWFGVNFACSGNDSDECHQWCAEGCEEYCTVSHECNDGCPEPCPRDGDEHRWEPMPPHGESCRIVDWLDACGAEDTYAGDDEPLRVGTHPIEDEWTGDDYTWRYAEPAQPQSGDRP